jgi:hypothetical protein
VTLRPAWLESAKHWFGYGWFMSFGTFLPLGVFLGSYFVHLTLVGAPLARTIDRFGIWLATFGQEPPGQDRLDARSVDSGKRPLAERVRAHAPPGMLERRGRSVAWPLGALVHPRGLVARRDLGRAFVERLVPYPFLDTVRALLAELPSVMTLAYPRSAPPHRSR